MALSRVGHALRSRLQHEFTAFADLGDRRQTDVYTAFGDRHPVEVVLGEGVV